MNSSLPESLPGLVSPSCYEIRVNGRLDPSWQDWFESWDFETKEEQTFLIGNRIDQAALFGALHKLYILRMPLISVRILPDNG
jgi:hypothetical protein